VQKAGNIFIDTTVDDITTFLKIAMDFDRYLFRGQPVKYRCLSTSLERIIDDNL